MSYPREKVVVLDDDSTRDYFDNDVEEIAPFDAKRLRSHGHDHERPMKKVKLSSPPAANRDGRARTSALPSQVRTGSPVKPGPQTQPTPSVQTASKLITGSNTDRDKIAARHVQLVMINSTTSLWVVAPENLPREHVAEQTTSMWSRLAPHVRARYGDNPINFALAVERGSR